MTADGCRGSQLNDGDTLSIVVSLLRACCCGMGFSEVAKSQPRSKYAVCMLRDVMRYAVTTLNTSLSRPHALLNPPYYLYSGDSALLPLLFYCYLYPSNLQPTLLSLLHLNLYLRSLPHLFPSPLHLHSASTPLPFPTSSLHTLQATTLVDLALPRALSQSLRRVSWRITTSDQKRSWSGRWMRQ